jgi:hypothetical protein
MSTPWPSAPATSTLPSDEYDGPLDSPALARAQILALKERVDSLSAILRDVVEHGDPESLAAAAVSQSFRLGLRRLTQLSSGNLVLFDGSVLNTAGHWNSTSKQITFPAAYGHINCNLLLSNASGAPITSTFILLVADVPRAMQEITVPAGSTRGFSMVFTGYVGGAIDISSSVGFGSGGLSVLGSNTGGNGSVSNLGAVLYL